MDLTELTAWADDITQRLTVLDGKVNTLLGRGTGDDLGGA